MVKMRGYGNKHVFTCLFLLERGIKLNMSKLYSEYIKRKKIDDSKYYLFKSGVFYIFLSDDAKNISNITSLSITNLN